MLELSISGRKRAFLTERSDQATDCVTKIMNAEKYRRWFAYEKDSDAKVLASLQAVADPLRVMPQYQKAVDLLAHLVAARNMWLYRLGHGSKPPELFPLETPLANLPKLLDEMETAWSSYFENLTDEEIERVFEYRSYEGLALSGIPLTTC